MTMTLDHTAYRLSLLADCGDPDSPESPGALFLLGIQDDVNEAWEADAAYPEDGHSRIADMATYNAEARGTHNKWQVFVDLAAWQEEITELGFDGPVEMNKGADICLYIIAERLAGTLWAELDEAHESDEDDTEEES